MLLLSTIVAAAPVSDVWVLAPDRRALAHPGLGFAEGEQDGWLRLHATDAGLEVIGLMGVALLAEPQAARPGFSVLRRLVDRLDLDECSMGMSADLEIAVDEGATMVRIGRDLFGERLG